MVSFDSALMLFRHSERVLYELYKIVWLNYIIVQPQVQHELEVTCIDNTKDKT